MGRVTVVARKREERVGRGRKITRASNTEPSLISPAERCRARFIRLIFIDMTFGELARGYRKGQTLHSEKHTAQFLILMSIH